MSEPVRWELAEGVAEIVFDDPERPVNVLDERTLHAFEKVLDEASRAQRVVAFVIASAKPGQFIAGADLDAIRAVREPAVAIAAAARVQALFGRLDSEKRPVVAAIDGLCLGGGLELALACHQRIASDAPATRLGLPEVQLGLIPGFGGTQRLPRLVGIHQACQLILSGRKLDARRARRIGLVDQVFPQQQFRERVRRHARALVDASGRYRRRRPGPPALPDHLLLVAAPARDVYFGWVERRARAETQGYYPAPLKAIQAMREGLRKPLKEGLELEAALVGELATSPECKNLIRVFNLMERARKQAGSGSGAPPPVTRAGVVGAGVMGSQIAALLARRGIAVVLKDLSPAALRKGLERVAAEVNADLRRGRLDAREARQIMARISPTSDERGFAQVGIVIEAVAEDLGVKRELLAALEPRLGEGAVVASNTSAISISELAAGLQRPQALVGLHFFNPVRQLPLVEVVRGRASSDRALATALGLAGQLGKTPVVVADAPGFLVNRLLMAYLMEAVALVEAGQPIERIDRAMRAFGMPMGPLELLDLVGLDVARDAAASMARAFGDRMLSSRLLAELASAGRLGKKAGHGFYLHGRHARRKPRPDTAGVSRLIQREAPETKRGVLQERLVMPMINEGARCLEESVVARAGDVDMASILGFRFPAFRGGVLRFADDLGLVDVHARLERLAESEGARFAPSRLVVKLANEGLRFKDLDPIE